MIPYGKQEITNSDIADVTRVLKSKLITQGNIVPKFEQKISKKVNSKYAVAVNSATSALHIACLALSITKGDIVWTSAITFVASANCARYCGADVDFVDINLDTFNISISSLEAKLIQAKKINKLPKLLIVVHMCGQSCDMEAIYKLSKEYNFSIIEDASHALGGNYRKKPVGSCNFSDITIFSFHPVKIITTGEGGMAVTNNKNLYEKLQLFRTHGITRNKKLMNNKDVGYWHYEQLFLGYNYRMTDIAAALGISQLSRLKKYVDIRNKLAKVYNRELISLPINLPIISEGIKSSYHLYVIRLDEKNPKVSKSTMMNKFKKNNIGASFHYMPVYKHPYYVNLKKTNYKNLINAEKYFSSAISIPIYPTMKEKEQKKVIRVLKDTLS